MATTYRPPNALQRVARFTTTGANSWTVPAGVSEILITKIVGGGGSGGAGQNSANTAGGGGGGANAASGSGANGYVEIVYVQ